MGTTGGHCSYLVRRRHNFAAATAATAASSLLLLLANRSSGVVGVVASSCWCGFRPSAAYSPPRTFASFAGTPRGDGDSDGEGNIGGGRVRFSTPRTTPKTARAMSRASSSSDAVRSALLGCPTIALRDGTLHPCIGYGTYKVGYVPPSASSAVEAASAASSSSSRGAAAAAAATRTAKECVSDALELGYRFLECAEFYNNQNDVGRAIAESGIPRSELYLCSKVWTTTIERGPDAVRSQLQKTLEELGTDYLDLYLVHWPVPGKHVEAYRTLEELVKDGKVRNIGVSNYAVEDYLELKDAGIELLPSVNQIEINPFLYRKNTIDFFTREGVVLQSYRSLRDGKAFQHPTLLRIADRYEGKTTAQILGRWCIQHGFVYMPKSVNKGRMAENANVFDFELSDEHMAELDSLTTSDAIDVFVALYRKCVNRDTTKDGTMDGVKMVITAD